MGFLAFPEPLWRRPDPKGATLRRIRLFWTVLALALVAVLTMTLAPAIADRLPQPRIVIDNFTFRPNPLTVAPGTVITVINEDGDRQEPVPHTVTALSGAFDTGVVWDTAQFRAPTTRGVYQYFCEIHPFMKARLRVTNQA